MKFIILTLANGVKARINLDRIVAYYTTEEHTKIELSRDSFEGTYYYIRETPEEVDKLLIANGILIRN